MQVVVHHLKEGTRERDGGCREGEETGGSGERRAVERDGQREDREGEGEAHGARGAGGGEREAGGERASELETRQRFMGREGSMAAPRWPAGRWGHVTRPGPRRPPSLADALARPGGGPEVMITRAGTRRSPCPHSRAARPGEREAMPGREGAFLSHA